ncbi:hypothetical protein [Streptomyces sp. MP131-18]|uniref:YqeB family protein n=1 Tax=Streptomyces sp. MP131-18 TaxID=1857892 RepID=UPI00097BDE70|nr:hypothetical protein [Streptomyces sp. MP131-18]
MEYGKTTGPTVLGLSLRDRLLIIVGAPVLGVLFGAVLPPVAGWLADRPWAPMQGPFELIASFDGPWVAVALAAAGLLLGLGFAALALASCLKVTLVDGEIRLDKDGMSRRIARSDVDAVFVDGKQLVILDPASRELLRERHESSPAALARGFQEHGYRWAGQSDPYAELYRRWVPGTPDLPPAANAVLRARETALRKKHGDDVAELREEVQKLGFVVRDREDKQYWRPLVRTS